MAPLTDYLWIAIGSALGGVARHGLTVCVTARLGNEFPWGTLLVNITGCFLIGLCAPLFSGERARAFIAIGILGGYTTFSAFSLQTLHLVQQQRFSAALAYVSGAVASCLIAVWLGHAAASALSR